MTSPDPITKNKLQKLGVFFDARKLAVKTPRLPRIPPRSHHVFTTTKTPKIPKTPQNPPLHHAGFNFVPKFPHIPPSRDIKVYSDSRTLVFVHKDRKYGQSSVVDGSGHQLQPHETHQIRKKPQKTRLKRRLRHHLRPSLFSNSLDVPRIRNLPHPRHVPRRSLAKPASTQRFQRSSE